MLPIVTNAQPVTSAPNIANIFLVFIVLLLREHHKSSSQLYLLEVDNGTDLGIKEEQKTAQRAVTSQRPGRKMQKQKFQRITLPLNSSWIWMRLGKTKSFLSVLRIYKCSPLEEL